VQQVSQWEAAKREKKEQAWEETKRNFQQKLQQQQETERAYREEQEKAYRLRTSGLPAPSATPTANPPAIAHGRNGAAAIALLAANALWSEAAGQGVITSQTTRAQTDPYPRPCYCEVADATPSMSARSVSHLVNLAGAESYETQAYESRASAQAKACAQQLLSQQAAAPPPRPVTNSTPTVPPGGFSRQTVQELLGSYKGSCYARRSGPSRGAGMNHPTCVSGSGGGTGSQLAGVDPSRAGPPQAGPPQPFFQPKEGRAGSKGGDDNEPTKAGGEQSKEGRGPEEVRLMKVKELKEELARRGVSTHGACTYMHMHMHIHAHAHAHTCRCTCTHMHMHMHRVLPCSPRLHSLSRRSPPS